MSDKKIKMSYKDYKVTFDNKTGDLLLYKDRNNQIVSVVDADVRTEKELIEIVKLVLKTVGKMNEDHLNSLVQKMQAIEIIESICAPSKFN